MRSLCFATNTVFKTDALSMADKSAPHIIKGKVEINMIVASSVFLKCPSMNTGKRENSQNFSYVYIYYKQACFFPK